MSSICTKLDSAPAFSHGMAELTLKNPPPTEPSVLIDACVATGRSRLWGTPPTSSRSAPMAPSGSSTKTSDRRRSTQKLPRPEPERDVNPRMTAIPVARPTAADRNDWPPIATICEKTLNVVSPA